MKLLSWNLWGLGNRKTIRRLRHTLRHFNPFCNFLDGNKITKYKEERVHKSCDFTNVIDLPSIGSGEGLKFSSK